MFKFPYEVKECVNIEKVKAVATKLNTNGCTKITSDTFDSFELTPTEEAFCRTYFNAMYDKVLSEASMAEEIMADENYVKVFYGMFNLPFYMLKRYWYDMHLTEAQLEDFDKQNSYDKPVEFITYVGYRTLNATIHKTLDKHYAKKELEEFKSGEENLLLDVAMKFGTVILEWWKEQDKGFKEEFFGDLLPCYEKVLKAPKMFQDYVFGQILECEGLLCEVNEVLVGILLGEIEMAYYGFYSIEDSDIDEEDKEEVQEFIDLFDKVVNNPSKSDLYELAVLYQSHSYWIESYANFDVLDWIVSRTLEVGDSDMLHEYVENCICTEDYIFDMKYKGNSLKDYAEKVGELTESIGTMYTSMKYGDIDFTINFRLIPYMDSKFNSVADIEIDSIVADEDIEVGILGRLEDALAESLYIEDIKYSNYSEYLEEVVSEIYRVFDLRCRYVLDDDWTDKYE